MWLSFLSYKIGRLLLPFAMLAIAISSFGLANPWRVAAISGQAVCYLLAALDGVVPPAWMLKRLSSPARTFTAMMLAAVCGLAIFFVPPQSLWKITSAAPPNPRREQS
jgi:hypothetical protein